MVTNLETGERIRLAARFVAKFRVATSLDGIDVNGIENAFGIRRRFADGEYLHLPELLSVLSVDGVNADRCAAGATTVSGAAGRQTINGYNSICES